MNNNNPLAEEHPNAQEARIDHADDSNNPEHVPCRFWKSVDLADLEKYLTKVRRLSHLYSVCLVSYFRDYQEAFFAPFDDDKKKNGDDPQEQLLLLMQLRQKEMMQKLSVAKMTLVCQAMQYYGDYCLYSTNDPSCKEFINKVISSTTTITRSSNGPSASLKNKKTLKTNKTPDDDFIAEKIRKLLATDTGDMGVVIKAGLFSGLRQDELSYVYCMDVCANKFGQCKCPNLHLASSSGNSTDTGGSPAAIGVTTIDVNWIRGAGGKKERCHLAMMPTRVWEQFRNLPSFSEKDIVIANWVTNRLASICFTDLRDVHRQVVRSVMDDATAGIILSGTASVATAQEYMARTITATTKNDKAGFEGLLATTITKLEEQYCKAWRKFGVILGGWRQATRL